MRRAPAEFLKQGAICALVGAVAFLGGAAATALLIEVFTFIGG